MHIATTIQIALALLTISTPLLASQEGILTLDSLHAESRGIDESGPVTVNATQTPDGMTLLQVEAFGKSIRLFPSQLRELDGGPYNSIQLSYERGYKHLGGRTIYIKLSKAFTSGEARSVLVVIKENSEVKIKKELSTMNNQTFIR